MKKYSRNDRRRRIQRRIRFKLDGTTERPRLCVFRSLKHTYVQLIDDENGVTLASASTLKLGKGKTPNGANVAAAKEVGKLVAERAKEKGIENVVFDRAGYVYRGRIRAVADAAREAGLKF